MDQQVAQQAPTSIIPDAPYSSLLTEGAKIVEKGYDQILSLEEIRRLNEITNQLRDY